MTANAFLKPASSTATPVESSAPANTRKMLAALIVVAAVASIIAFGSLMGAMFIGQQFLQNVPDYSTVNAGFAIRSEYRTGACSHD